MSDTNSNTGIDDIKDQSEYVDYVDYDSNNEEIYEKEHIQPNEGSCIADDLITYVEEMALPMCEYIDCQTIDDFIIYLTKI